MRLQGQGHVTNFAKKLTLYLVNNRHFTHSKNYFHLLQHLTLNFYIRYTFCSPVGRLFGNNTILPEILTTTITMYAVALQNIPFGLERTSLTNYNRFRLHPFVLPRPSQICLSL